MKKNQVCFAFYVSNSKHLSIDSMNGGIIFTYLQIELEIQTWKLAILTKYSQANLTIEQNQCWFTLLENIKHYGLYRFDGHKILWAETCISDAFETDNYGEHIDSIMLHLAPFIHL